MAFDRMTDEQKYALALSDQRSKRKVREALRREFHRDEERRGVVLPFSVKPDGEPPETA